MTVETDVRLRCHSNKKSIHCVKGRVDFVGIRLVRRIQILIVVVTLDSDRLRSFIEWGITKLIELDNLKIF